MSTSSTQTDTHKPIRKPRNRRIAKNTTTHSPSPKPNPSGKGFDVPVGETGETFESVWRFGE